MPDLEAEKARRQLAAAIAAAVVAAQRMTSIGQQPGQTASPWRLQGRQEQYQARRLRKA